MNKVLLLTAAILQTLQCVCSEDNSTDMSRDPRVVKVTEGSNLFGLRLYNVLASSHSNFAICPLSLSSGLSMIYFGVRGDLATELNLTLGYDVTSLDDTDLLEAYEKTFQVLNAPHPEYQFSMATSMWIQKSFNIEEDFRSIVTRAFAAQIEDVDFSDSNTTEQINRWASDHTSGKIQRLFNDNIDSRTMMLLLNAVYFKGTWMTQFDPTMTFPGRFLNHGGSDWSEVPMMSVSSSFRYFNSEDLEAEVVELPYAGQEASMLVILPNHGVNLTDVEARLTPHDLYSFISNMTEHKVSLTMPRFKIQETMDLKESLSRLGLSSLFSGADFGGITKKKGLSISDVLQRTVVEVNEEGTEAAAITSMIFSKKKSSGERIMFVNRPFMFIIGHIPTGSMIFLGRVEEL